MGQLTVDLQTFTVIKKHDVDRDNPYLWIIALKLDRDAGLVAIALAAGTRSDLSGTGILTTRDPTVGNLGEKFKKGESRTIPDALGRIALPITRLPNQDATFLLLITAMEHSTTTKKTQREAYNAMVGEIEDFIVERMKALETNPPSDADLQDLQDTIRDRVKKIFRPNPLSDNFIASQTQELTLGQSAFTRVLNLDFVSKYGGTHYTIAGTAVYSP